MLVVLQEQSCSERNAISITTVQNLQERFVDLLLDCFLITAVNLASRDGGGESARLPPMWPGLIPLLVLALFEGFSPGSPVFFSLRKPTLQLPFRPGQTENQHENQLRLMWLPLSGLCYVESASKF